MHCLYLVNHWMCLSAYGVYQPRGNGWGEKEHCNVWLKLKMSSLSISVNNWFASIMALVYRGYRWPHSSLCCWDWAFPIVNKILLEFAPNCHIGDQNYLIIIMKIVILILFVNIHVLGCTWQENQATEFCFCCHLDWT